MSIPVVGPHNHNNGALREAMLKGAHCHPPKAALLYRTISQANLWQSSSKAMRSHASFRGRSGEHNLPQECCVNWLLFVERFSGYCHHLNCLENQFGQSSNCWVFHFRVIQRVIRWCSARLMAVIGTRGFTELFIIVHMRYIFSRGWACC